MLTTIRICRLGRQTTQCRRGESGNLLFGGRSICWPALALAMILLLSGGVALYGQLSTAAINGTVTDATGAAVPGATLTLANVETGVERQTETNEVGFYVFSNVAPGNYTLMASKEGFRKATVEPFTLEVNQTATFDVRLQVGSVTESVTVEATGVEIQASTAEVGSVINERQVLDLPLNGRNFTQLTLLTPGASPINTTQNSSGAGTSQVGQVSVPTMNGQTGRSNLYLADGALNLSAQHSTPAVAPIVDAIQEFKVQSHNDLAEFGQANGGIVNVVTKSGTNEFHGSAWEFLRNDNLDARNFFRKDVTPLAQNQFGATGGGPIIHNKTFFFGAYQGFRRRTPANRLYRVPTQANLQGDMSDWSKQIFNPFSGRVDPSDPNKVVRDPFPNNQIPGSLLDEGFLEYAQLTLPDPIPVGVGDFNQLDTTPTALNQNEYMVRIDHQQSPKDMFWGRWSMQKMKRTGSGGRQSLASNLEFTGYIIGGSWVHTFGPSSVMQVQYNFSLPRRSWGNEFRTLPEGFPGQIGYSDNYYKFRSGKALMPNVIVADYFSGGETFNRFTYGKTHAFKANYSKIIGRHNIKFGGEYNHVFYDRYTNDHNARFVSTDTADPQHAGTTGSPLASWLLNVPNRAGRRDFFKRLFGMAVFGFYAQDSWKPTPKLTLNFGLRYDYTKLPTIGTKEDRVIYTGTYDFKQSYGGLYVLQDIPGSCAELGDAPCIPTADGRPPEGVIKSPTGKLIENWSDNWQPRFGFAYRLTNKTAFRGSFGMFFDSWAGILQGTQALGHTWPDVGQRQSGNLNTPTPSSPLPKISAKNPFTTGAIPEPTPYNTVAWFVDPHLKDSYSMQWNFGIQQEFPANTLVTVNYVGSGNRRTSTGSFYNTAMVPGPGDPKYRRPFPNVKPTFWEQSFGTASYNALQLQIKSRTRDLMYMVNYTWSKTINSGCDGFYGTEGCQIQDPYHYDTNRSVAGTHLPHIFTAAFVYDLPFGAGKMSTGNSVADYIVGGWQVNGIVSLHSGRVFTVNINGDIANTGSRNGYMRPNLVGDPHLSNPTLSRWFNTDAFAAPPPYTFGNAGRNILAADGRTNLDLSLFKSFPLPWREGLKLQFRAEAFNAFNHPDFGTPAANMSSSRFGQVTSAAQERQVQLGLKLIF